MRLRGRVPPAPQCTADDQQGTKLAVVFLIMGVPGPYNTETYGFHIDVCITGSVSREFRGVKIEI